MPLSEARKRANAKWNKKAYDRLEIRVPKGSRESIVAHAKQRGESLNKFLNRAVNNQILMDNNDVEQVQEQKTELD